MSPTTNAQYTLRNGKWYSRSLGVLTPDPPPPPPTGSARFGSFTDGGESGWQALKADVGQGWCRRTYDSSMLPSSWGSCAAAGDTVTGAGAVPVSIYSFKPPSGNDAGLNAITNGTYDATINSFLASVPDTVTVNSVVVPHITIMALWHEPEDDIVKKGSITSAAWKAANVKFMKLVKATGRSTLRTAIITQGNYTFAGLGFGAYNTLDGLLWDTQFDTLCDYVGMDVYIKLANYPGQSGTIPTYERSTPLAMGPCEQWAKSHNKPIIVSELAWNEDPSNANAKSDDMEVFRTRAIAQGYYAVAYFDSYTSGTHYNLDPSFKLRSSLNATQKWASIQSRSS